MVLLMFFEALYFGHFLSFYTMQLEPPKRFLRDVLSHLHLRGRGGVCVVAGQRRDVVSVWNSMTTFIMQDQPTDVLCSVGVACIYGVVGVQCMAVTALQSGMCLCASFRSILL